MLKYYLWQRKWSILAYCLLICVATACMSAFQLYIAPIFDYAAVGEYREVILRMGWMFLWYISIRLLDYFGELLAVYLINSVRKQVKEDLFSALLSKPLSFYGKRNAGEYVAEFTNDISMLEQKFLRPCKEAFTYCVTVVSACLAIGTIDYGMSLVIAGGALICLGLPFLLTRYTSEKMLRFIVGFDHFVQHLKDLFTGLFSFRNYGVEKELLDRFSEENHKVEKLKFKAELSLEVMNSFVGRVSWSIEIFVLLLGLLAVLRGELGIGSVFSAYLLAGSLGVPLHSLGHRISMMRSVRGIEKKFLQTGILSSGDVGTIGNIDHGEAPFCIRTEGLSLSLDHKEILKDVSLCFEPGKKYLILGNNGSGKSTTAKLLKGSYDNYGGKIFLGGQELRTAEGMKYSGSISYSNENVCLLADSLYHNLCLYAPVTHEAVQEAVQTVDLQLPMDRQVGDGGCYLSGGERRKLEIARALLSKAKVLILDEVISTLDIETAYEIESLILSLKEQTVIMISNAFSGDNLCRYDEIILMDGGTVVDRGNHGELIRRCEAYRRLYTLRCGEPKEGGERP